MANTFRLEIVTPTGVALDEQVESCSIRTTEGEVGILANHIDYVAAIRAGEIRVKRDGASQSAAGIDGFAHMTGGNHLRILISSFEWAKDIDAEQALAEREAAKAKVEAAKTPEELALAKYQLLKARVRRSVSKKA